MSNPVETFIPPALADLATAVMALEGSTDLDLAETGRLLIAAAQGGRVAKVQAPLAQPVFDSIAKVVALKIESRRELVVTHNKLRRLGKAAMPDLNWGPAEQCPMGSAPDQRGLEKLRSVG